MVPAWFWTMMAFTVLASLYLCGGQLLVAVHTMASYTCTILLIYYVRRMVFASPASRPTMAVVVVVLLLVAVETCIVAVGLNYMPNVWPALLLEIAAGTIFMIATPITSSVTENEEASVVG
jgi:hypothetical protein